MNSLKLVSIIIRTSNRPDVLQTALNSVRKQFYPNIEVIVVEDGKNIAEEMIKQNYSDLNIKYLATGNKVGRSCAGNIGLSMANGQYINFLDDDDELFPWHIETLISVLDDRMEKAAYGIALERQIVIKHRNPYQYKIHKNFVRFNRPYNKCFLYFQNYFPIQSVMFSRELYDRLGGFDESLDVLEDWDLWVRYSTLTDYFYIDQITSIYYVNFKRKSKRQRDVLFHTSAKKLQEKYQSYNLNISIGSLSEEITDIVENYTSSKFIRYLRRILNFVVYGEK